MTKMKLTKFLAALSVVAVCLASAPRAHACEEVDYSGYSSSPFLVVQSLYADRWGNGNAYDETLDFWSGYVKGAVGRATIEEFFDDATLDSVAVSRNGFMRYLKSRGDQAAIDYISRCLELSDVLADYRSCGWDYKKPSKAGFKKLLADIDRATVTETFRPRYEFLKIRIYGAMGDNKGVMKVWNQAGKGMKPSALRDRMEGYVGGVLYRQGRYVDALDYFYRTGDNASIAWCIDKLAGASNLKSLYEHNPNSLALRYIVQDFMNYLIATSDAGRCYGKAKATDDDFTCDDYTIYSDDIRDLTGHPVYDASKQRGEMMKLFKRIVDEKKTDTPMMWATALGVLQAMDGRVDEGLATMRLAANMQGDLLMKDNLDNFILWALMLRSGKGDTGRDTEFIEAWKEAYASLDRTATELTYDYSKKGLSRRNAYDSERSLRQKPIFFTEFFALEAATHYNNLGQPHRALALMAMLDVLPPALCGDRFMKQMREDLDQSLSLDDAKRFADFIKAPAPTADAIDACLHPYAARYVNLANDVIGTRLMRAMQFDEALTYLEKVDPRWIRTQAIYPYLRGGYYDPEYYNFRRNCTSPGEGMDYDCCNNKAQYCSEMIEALDRFKALNGKDKAMKALEIAAMLHFASPMGDGWALTDYAWSIYDQESEFTDASRQWLLKVHALTDDPLARNLAAYAQLCFPGENTEDVYDDVYPFDYTTDGHGKVDKYYLSYPTEGQLQALDYLKGHWDSVKAMPYHVTHCDVLQSYMAGNFIDRPKSERWMR